jgi:hypothetical protein
MNIHEFRSSFENVGEPASPTNYEVSIIRQPTIRLVSGESNSFLFENNVKFRCISCSLPGRILNTTDRNTYGPNRKIVTSAMFQDVTFSFIVSDDKNELNYFDSWHNYIVNNTLFTRVSTHDVRYYDDYVGDIKIIHYDKLNTIKYTISLIEAYPISVEEIPLSWDNTNEFIRVNVTVAYRNWIKTE